MDIYFDFKMGSIYHLLCFKRTYQKSDKKDDHSRKKLMALPVDKNLRNYFSFSFLVCFCFVIDYIFE